MILNNANQISLKAKRISEMGARCTIGQGIDGYHRVFSHEGLIHRKSSRFCRRSLTQVEICQFTICAVYHKS